MTRRRLIEATIRDLVSDLLYHDRKAYQHLSRGAVEEAVAAGEITADEIVELFRKDLVSVLRKT